MQAPPEKLGTFYLGAEYNLDAGSRSDAPTLYDSRDLLTHALVVGMTGSGKTGMCVGLLEEAALDRIPAIIIDPKGDMGNLLLQFPQLRPDDFQTWVDPGEAERKGKSIEELAASTAENWRSGLTDWGIGSERIQAVLDSVDYTIFTPGSDAGVPINILGSLNAPGLDWAVESEAIRERINGTVAALMGLAGINADPIRSREGVLLASIFEHYWKQEQNLDLQKLVLAITEPPVRQVGVFDVDTFYPAKERFSLAMAFNNLVAAPSFQAWLTGEPLDVQSLLYTAEGKPRHSIFYVAHLSDSERMFFVTLLLENVLTWVRRQSGTTSLRAILYFDEIFGYFPPVAEPPSKRPLMTLMKQARAFGVGCVLVTQNPVDVDYKGLTNAGTWVIGKLQAERDKARVLDGLKGALSEAGTDTSFDYDSLIPRLGNRVFLMHNVHQSGPAIFTTRWVHSYLRGPLTKPQVRTLMEGKQPAVAAPAPVEPAAQTLAAGPTAPAPVTAAPAAAAPAAPAVAAEAEVQTGPGGFSNALPAVDDRVQQVFLPVRMGDRAAVAQIGREAGSLATWQCYLTYEPAALGAASVFFGDRKLGIERKEERVLLAPLPDGPGFFDWGSGETLPLRLRDLGARPERIDPSQGPYFAPVPPTAETPTGLKKLQTSLNDYLYHNARLPVQVHEGLKIVRKPNEDERDFLARLDHAARELRDAEVDELEKRFEKKIDALEVKVQKEQAVLAENKAKAQSRRTETYVTAAESVLSFFMGRRATRPVSQQFSKVRQAGDAAARVAKSEAEIERLTADIAELEAELKEEVDKITSRWENLRQQISTEEVAPRRTDVNIELLALAWVPSWVVEYEENGLTRSKTVAAYTQPE